MIDRTNTPSTLAVLLTSALQRVDGDSESAAIITDARTKLERLAWARFAAQTRRACRAESLRRRHQGHGHSDLWDGRTVHVYGGHRA